MTAVSVLTAAKINHRKVERRLVRAGYTTVGRDATMEVSRGHGHGGDAVAVSPSRVDHLPPERLEVARRLLGIRPWTGVTCRFDGVLGAGQAWATVVDIARAVAAEVPLAVLDDHAGTAYLIHAGRGLIPPDEYNQTQAPTAAADFLRRLLGN